MKDLINNIIAFFTSVLDTGSLSAKIVYKGFENMPDQVPPDKFPYIAIDDGGERVERGEVGQSTQNRIYTVLIEFGVLVKNPATILDNVLDLSDQIKALIETEANRQLDGHVWGISIVPFEAEDENEQKFAGRRIAVDFWELEDTYMDY